MADRVSIVINTYNRCASLRRTLESLEHLEYPAFEVVVVNGPSTDDTVALLEEYADRIRIGRCAHRNLSESRNIGIRLAAGEFVAFLDDDAYPDPAWLDRLVEGFDKDEVAAVGGPVYDHTGATLQARYSLATRFGDARVCEGPNPTDYLNVPFSSEFLYTIGTNTLFRYERLTDIGGFDEEFEYYLDETDVCCRLVDLGYVVKAIDDGFVYHKFLESAVRTPNRAIRNRFSILKNQCYFALKHALRTNSFYEVCTKLVELVERSRNDFRWNVEHGLLTKEDFERFELDVHAAFNAAIERHQSGNVRIRPPEWFDEDQQTFLPFRPRRARSAKLHICFFSQEYPPGPVNGIARVIHTLATGLAAKGHLVRVLTRGESHNRVDLEDGVWVHRVVVSEHSRPEGLDIPRRIWDYSASLLDELVGINEHRAVDLVEAPNWDSEIVAVLLDGRFRTVVGLYTPLSVVRALDPDLVRSDPDVDAMIEVDRFCCQHATALRAAGLSVVEAIEEAYGLKLPRERIAFMPHGMVDATHGVDPSRRGAGPNVLYVGRLEKRKGIDTLLASVPEVLDEFPDVTFTIVGDDSVSGESGVPYREAFERHIGGSLPSGAVQFTGIVDDEERQRLYAGCDVFVAPSRFESFGLILVEAMMFGKPVIGGDNGGMRNIVEVGGNGFLVPPGDVESFRHCLVALLESPERRAAFGRRSRQIFEERFSVERMVNDCNAFYDGLVGRTTVDDTCPPDEDALTASVPDTAVPPASSSKIPSKAIALPVPVEADGFVDRMRCPTCHSCVRPDAHVVTSDGKIKTGYLWCAICREVVAEIDNFKFNFHARGGRRQRTTTPLVVPRLGERRVRADDDRLVRSGTWRPHGGFLLSDGRTSDVLSHTGEFTDAAVRLLRNAWSGIVDIFIDDQLVESVDLFMPEGSLVVPVTVARDLPLRERTIALRPRGAAHAEARATQVLCEEVVLYGPREMGFPPPIPINRGNPFSEVIERYLDVVPSDELVLECGGGDRRRCRSNHLNFEYLPFEFADLYGDIHAVPFQDDTFGLVFSQAVFEHVRNPFEAAQELIRVTRPGGLILTEVAFLQPLHAVPYHFFNMTTWGVEELFKSCALVETDWFGELSATVEWLLRSVNVANKIDDERRRRLMSEFEELDRLVSHEDLKAAASGVYLVARKIES